MWESRPLGLEARGKHVERTGAGRRRNLTTHPAIGYALLFALAVLTSGALVHVVHAHAASPGATVLVSTDSTGVQGNYVSGDTVISADGRYVVFQSSATNLVPGVTDGVGHLYRKEIATGAISLVSADSSSTPAASYCTGASISGDGRNVAFNSWANLVPGDTNNAPDIYVKDMKTGRLVCASTNSSGTFGNELSWMPAISADGHHVAFTSVASNLVPGDTNRVCDVFVKNIETGAVQRVSTDSSGAQVVTFNSDASGVSISGDGRYVVFCSAATNLVQDDTNGAIDVFIKDTKTGETRRVSTDSNGRQADTESHRPSLSADGCYVAFLSYATNLVPGDTNDVEDVFVKNMVTSEVCMASTDSSGAPGNGASAPNPSISSNGRFVVFDSLASNLASGDANGASDVFMKDLMTTQTVLVSVDAAGDSGNGDSGAAGVSSDGRLVAFASIATNLVPGDTNGFVDAFVRDTGAGSAVDPNLDFDGDGLPNGWEINGVDTDGDGKIEIDLPAMGADPFRKDIFVEIDWMATKPVELNSGGWLRGHNHKPSPEAMRMVVTAFRDQGIALHIDAGPDSELRPGVKWGDLSQAGPTHELESLGWLEEGNHYEPYAGVWERGTLWNWTQAKSIRNWYFKRDGVFRYCLFAHQKAGGNSGIAEFPPGSDFIVFQGWNGGMTVTQEAGTFMHELGHTLGLFHGGSDQVGQKPNYLSVMNYSFQLSGLMKHGEFGAIDYSRQELDSLWESHLDETKGLTPSDGLGAYGTTFWRSAVYDDFQDIKWASGPIDWNGFWGSGETDVRVNLNGNKDESGNELDDEVLVGHDDWSNLDFSSIGHVGGTASRRVASEASAQPIGSVDEPTLEWFTERGLLQGDRSVSVVAEKGNTLIATPGPRMATLGFRIHNSGTVDDRYALRLHAPDLATEVDLPTTVALMAGESTTVPVMLTLPGDVADGLVGTVQMTAVSEQSDQTVDEEEVSVYFESHGSVEGTVTSEGQPLAGVSVTVGASDPVTSTSDGTFSVAEVTPGRRTVTFSKAGFEIRTATVTVAAGLPSVVSVGLVRLSTISLSTESTSSLGYGAAFRIGGVLRSGADGASGAQVLLQSALPGAGFQDNVLRATTGHDGAFTFLVRPATKTQYRVRFAGSTGRAASGPTKSVYAVPRVQLLRSTSWSKLRRSRTYYAKGYVAPKHATSDGNKVKVRAYKRASSGKYNYKKSFTAKYFYYSTGKTRYKAAVKLTSKGKWKLVAYHAADSKNAKTYGSADYFTVK